MIFPYESPTGGIGEPLEALRPYRAKPCANNHRDPEAAGDCSCADLASERAERLSGECGWETAEQCHASARRCRSAGLSYLCRIH